MRPSADLAVELEAAGVRLLVLSLVDNAGITRVKAVPLKRLSAVLERGIGLSPAFAVMCIDDHITSTPRYGGLVGDIRLMVDLESCRIIDRKAGIAWAATYQVDQELNPFPVCQRHAVRQQELAAHRHGFSFTNGFEIEFTLFRDDGSTAHEGPGYGLTPFLVLEDFICDLVDSLDQAGLPVETVHPEYASGQFEVSLGPASPLAATDDYVLARLIVHRTARRHQLTASLAPMVADDDAISGNGCHIHMSATQNEQNVFAKGSGAQGLSPAGESFIAGLLNNLAAASAIYAPSVASGERLTPGRGAGAFANWGHENREAALRMISGTASARTSSANVELKVPDATCNPYVAVAAMIASALDGFTSGAELESPIDVDPSQLTTADRSARGARVIETDLAAKLDILDGSATLRKALNDDLADCLVAVRRYECERYGSLSAEERIALVRSKY